MNLDKCLKEIKEMKEECEPKRKYPEVKWTMNKDEIPEGAEDDPNVLWILMNLD
jgi:hypothetical protein